MNIVFVYFGKPFVNVRVPFVATLRNLLFVNSFGHFKKNN